MTAVADRDDALTVTSPDGRPTVVTVTLPLPGSAVMTAVADPDGALTVTSPDGGPTVVTVTLLLPEAP
jgi:hypothetical protein